MRIQRYLTLDFGYILLPRSLRKGVKFLLLLDGVHGIPKVYNCNFFYYPVFKNIKILMLRKNKKLMINCGRTRPPLLWYH